MDNAFAFVAANGGLCTENDYPYTSGNTSRASVTSQSKRCKAVAAAAPHNFTDVQQNSEAALMSAVAMQPVSIAIEADGTSHVPPFPSSWAACLCVLTHVVTVATVCVDRDGLSVVQERRADGQVRHELGPRRAVGGLRRVGRRHQGTSMPTPTPRQCVNACVCVVRSPCHLIFPVAVLEGEKQLE